MKIKAEEAPVLEEIKEVGKQPCPSLVDIQQLLSFIDPQELSKFICEYASTNLEFKTALSNHFIAKELSLSSKGKDYRIEIPKRFLKDLVTIKGLVITIVMIITTVTGKLFSIRWTPFFGESGFLFEFGSYG